MTPSRTVATAAWCCAGSERSLAFPCLNEPERDLHLDIRSPTMKAQPIKTRAWRRHLTHLGVLLSGGLIFGATWAIADGDTTTQDVVGANMRIPYNGYLMRDNEPINGQRTIQFDLYESALSSAVSQWSETHTVDFRAGKFSVALGSTSALTDTILDAEQLYLGMTILDDDGTGAITPIELAGRHAITTSPYSAWAPHSATLDVGGTLNVADNVAIAGDENDGSVAALVVKSGSKELLIDANELHSRTGTLYLNPNTKNNVKSGNWANIRGATLQLGTDSSSGRGDGGTALKQTSSDSLRLNYQGEFSGGTVIDSDLMLDGRFRPLYQTWVGGVAGTGDGYAAIANDNNTYKTLMITGNDSAGGLRQIKMYDDVYINKNMTVTKATTAPSVTVDDLTVTSSVSSTPSCQGSPKVDLYSSFSSQRLCIYEHGLTSGSRGYHNLALVCRSTYGGELCSYNQMAIAMKKNTSLVLKTNYWMRDRTNDDEALYVNNATNEDNFEGVKSSTSNLSGAYCCVMYQGR